MKIGFSPHNDGPGGARSWIKSFSEYCINNGHTVTYDFTDKVDVFCSVADISKPDELDYIKKNNIKILQRLGAIFLPYNHPNQVIINSRNEITKKLIEYADDIVYQSKFSKECLFRSIYNDKEPIGDIIYNSANNHIFSPVGCRVPRPNNKKIILAIAYWGTPHTATNSIKILMNVIDHYENRNDIEFWILGRAFPIHEKMISDASFKNVKKLDLLNPIPRDNMPDLLRTPDMILHLKAHEACPNFVIETMFTGTPIVGINSGSLPEILGDSIPLANCIDENLENFPIVDLDDLINKINMTLENYSYYSHLLLEKSKSFLPEFTYKIFLNKLIKLANSN